MITIKLPSIVSRNPWWWLLGLYLFSHLFQLTALPIFADEAIYIRWAQLIIDEPGRYLFFPLNDGKTPLQMWLLVPSLLSISNQLWAARFMSVLAGVVQIFFIKKTVQALGGNQASQWLAAMWVAILPFWFFHHRMALIDGLLTLFISVSFYFSIRLANELKKTKVKLVWSRLWPLMIGTGVGLGLALLTKLPALFFIPVLGLVAVWYLPNWKLNSLVSSALAFGLSTAIGIGIFLLLKIHPAFGQLFSRGNDFTFSMQEVLAGEWFNSWNNLWRFSWWWSWYLSPVVTGLSLFTLTSSKWRKTGLMLVLAAVGFSLPFMIFGKVVAPRYILPSVIFFTLAGSLMIGDWWQSKQRWLAQILIGTTLVWSVWFMLPSWFAVNQIPFVKLDQQQYLLEWSSGHGIQQTVELIQERAKSGRVVVATEGFFGTLPDGILVYLHNQDVSNIEVFGVGVPVNNLPDEYFTKVAAADYGLVVVNSHRNQITDPRFQLLTQFPRKGDAPSLQVYEYQP